LSVRFPSRSNIDGGETFDEGFRADLIVEGKAIVEVKSVEKFIQLTRNRF
jgi:hypothetical protein